MFLTFKELSLAGGYTTISCPWIALEGKENSKRKKQREKEGRNKLNFKTLSAFLFFSCKVNWTNTVLTPIAAIKTIYQK